MELESRVLQLIERIYAAATDPDRWQDFVQDLSDALDGAYVGLGLNAPEDPWAGTAYLVGITPEYRRRFPEHLIRGLPFAANFGPETSKRFISLDEVLPTVDLAESEFYQSWMKPQNLAPHWPIGVGIYLDGKHPAGWCYVWRPEPGGPFTAADLAFCDALLPHLNRAVRIHLTLGASRSEGRALGEVIDRLPTGVILLDSRGQMVSANRSAEAILAQKDGFGVGPNGVYADKPRDREALRDAVASALEADQGESQSGGFTAITRPSGKRAYVVLVTPLLAALPSSQMGDAAAAVFIADPEGSRVSETQMLETVYQLTPAEAELVRLIASGYSLEEAARRRDVTVNTARGQLKHVFAKTDTKRQGDLVRLVLTGVGTIRNS